MAQDIETLVSKFTAFRSFGEMKESMLTGYVPTIVPKAEELGKELEQRGWKVWRSNPS